MDIKLIRKNKPVFYINGSDDSVATLLDTGAFFSVFTLDASMLLQLFPNAYLTNYKIHIGGFGGDGKYSDVYIIPEINCSGIIIKNLPIALYPKESIYEAIVLSSVVFSKTPFTIDYLNKKITLHTNNYVINCCDLISTKGNNLITEFEVVVAEEYLQVLCERYNLDVEVVKRFLPKDYAKLSAEQLEASVRYISDMM